MPSSKEASKRDSSSPGAALPSIRALFGLGPTDDLGEVNRRQIQIVQDPRSASLDTISHSSEALRQVGQRSSHSSNSGPTQPASPGSSQSSSQVLLPQEHFQPPYSRSSSFRSHNTLRPILSDSSQGRGPDGHPARSLPSLNYRVAQISPSLDPFHPASGTDSRHPPDGGSFDDVRLADMQKLPTTAARRPQAESTSAPYPSRQQSDRNEDSGGRLAYLNNPGTSASPGQWRVNSSEPIGQGGVGSHTSQINMRPPKNLMEIALAQEASGSGQKYECSWCHKTFNRPSSLAIHKNIHTGEKPFVCSAPGCGRSFSVLSNMRRHARTHDASSSRGKRRLKVSQVRKEDDPEADCEGGEDEDLNSGGRDGQEFDIVDLPMSPRKLNDWSGRRSRLPSSSRGDSSSTTIAASEFELEWAADEHVAARTARERSHFRERDRRPSPVYTSSEDELDTETEAKQPSQP